MINGREKSDSAILAAKSANNAGYLAAERVKRRTKTKETRGKDTYRAQNRGSVSHGMERVRQAAKQRKKEPFSALHHVTIDRLRE